MNKKWLIFNGILLALFINLQYHLRFGKGSYTELQTLANMIAKQQQENAVLKQRNQTLTAEIADLKTDFNAIEERARTELGLVKSNEVFYQIVE